MDKKIQVNDNNVPVGYPLEDIEVLLLDDDGKEVAFNEIGEMSVRSRYLSPGYWRRPELSQVKFLSDPNGGDERIYRTGDLGLILDDGCLVHMGGDVRDHLRSNFVLSHHNLQRVHRGMCVPARGMVLERSLGERPAFSEAIG